MADFFRSFAELFRRPNRAVSEGNASPTPQVKQRVVSHIPPTIVEEQAVRVDSRQSILGLYPDEDGDGEQLSPLCPDDSYHFQSEDELSQASEALEYDHAFVSSPNVTVIKKTGNSLFLLNDARSGLSAVSEKNSFRDQLIHCIVNSDYRYFDELLATDLFKNLDGAAPRDKTDISMISLAEEFCAKLATSVVQGKSTEVPMIMEEAKKNKLEIDSDLVYNTIIDNNNTDLMLEENIGDDDMLLTCGFSKKNKPYVGLNDGKYKNDDATLAAAILYEYKHHNDSELESFLDPQLRKKNESRNSNYKSAKEKTFKRIQQLKADARLDATPQQQVSPLTEEILCSVKMFESPAFVKVPTIPKDDEAFWTPEAIINGPVPKKYLELCKITMEDSPRCEEAPPQSFLFKLDPKLDPYQSLTTPRNQGHEDEIKTVTTPVECEEMDMSKLRI